MAHARGTATNDRAVATPAPISTQIQPLAPQPGVVAPDLAQQLPRRILSREELLGVWFVLGVHGGAGESTLEALLPVARAADHTWPISPDPRRLARVMLVARTNHTGLLAAQLALRDWASGSARGRTARARARWPTHPAGYPKSYVGSPASLPAPRLASGSCRGSRSGASVSPRSQRASRPLQQLVHYLNHAQEVPL